MSILLDAKHRNDYRVNMLHEQYNTAKQDQRRAAKVRRIATGVGLAAGAFVGLEATHIIEKNEPVNDMVWVVGVGAAVTAGKHKKTAQAAQEIVDAALRRAQAFSDPLITLEPAAPQTWISQAAVPRDIVIAAPRGVEQAQHSPV